MLSPSSRSRLFLVSFFSLLLALSPSICWAASEESPPSSVELPGQDSDILSDEEFLKLIKTIKAQTNSTQQSLLVMLLKHYGGLYNQAKQKLLSSENLLKEAQLKLNDPSIVLKEQVEQLRQLSWKVQTLEEVLRKAQDKSNLLSTYLEAEPERTATAVSIGVAITAVVCIFGTKFFWR